jgi:NodT family efflux transporter outer membrane factor (OMF) lipoprotein
MLGRYLSFLALLLCLSGCFRPFYRPQPFSLGQTDLRENVQEAFSAETVTPAEICGEEWWHFFNDPQLDKFIELSLECHPDIRIADARIRIACEEARIARAALFPHVFGIGDVKRKKISVLGDGFVPGLPILFTETTLSLATSVYELDIWHKNRSLYFAALDHMQASIANYAEAKLLLSTTIAAVYFDLQMTLARKEVTLERLKARKELYDLHKQQFDLGIISEFRLYQVDTDVQLLKDLIFQLDAQIAIDKHAVAALVANVACRCGEDGEMTVEPSAEFERPFPLPKTLPIDLLTRRPDVTARKWLVEAACYDIKVAQANFFPRIDLMGYIGFQSIKIAELFRGKTLIALGEATATLPLYLAGKLRAQLGIAQKTLEIAIENYNQTVLNAVQQVSDALSNLTTADERKQALQLAIRDATDLYDLIKQRYKNAVYNKLAVLNAFENLYIQKDLEVQIELARYEAAVELIWAIGGGYREQCL